MLDKQFFLKVGPKVRNNYRKHIFGADATGQYIQQAKDVYDKKFNTYKEPYGSRKRADKFKRQASSFKSSTNPVLTSDLFKDFILFKTSDTGFQLSFASRGAIVKSLNDKGRVLTAEDQPLPKSTINFMLKEINTFIENKAKKTFPKSKTFKVGKK